MKSPELNNDDMDRITATLKAIGKIQVLVEPRGTMDCPMCQGQLTYYRSSFNGHTMGHCKTEGCLSWRQ